jgi:hypothetical protein
MTALGPNSKQPCPSDAHRRTALAHGRICPVCEPDAAWSVRCPLCLDTVTAVGLTIQPHQIDGRGHAFRGFACPGSGATVGPPQLADRPIWQPPAEQSRTVTLLPGGAA